MLQNRLPIHIEIIRVNSMNNTRWVVGLAIKPRTRLGVEGGQFNDWNAFAAPHYKTAVSHRDLADVSFRRNLPNSAKLPRE
jgi:hypothetical protein